MIHQMKYDHKKIEHKWQKRWLDEKVFRARDNSKKPKYYQLETFPYPSAEGLHVGHPKGYIAEDIHARYMRMKGREVLYTIGWDAFGLPTENYAIKVGKSPRDVAEANIKNFKRQVQMFGFSYDWDREINTSSPEYYKWTQWLFIELYKKELAYRAKAKVNWCPKDQTVLANEQVVGGVCDRCGGTIEQREMEQWFLKITDYAERLLQDLNGLDWPAATIKRQKDWIGKSEGAELEFPISNFQFPKGTNFVLFHGYSGSPDLNFFPWLKQELKKRHAKVYVPKLPNSDDPQVYDQVAEVLKTTPFDENTVLVGHSLGGVVAMKVLEKLKKPIKKTVLVTSFTQNRFLDEPFNEHAFDWKFDAEKIKANAGEIHILRDTTDKTVPQDQALGIQKLFGGTIFDFTAEKPHACAKVEPEVLRHCLDSIRVFTTRPDTLFGATYLVLAPEHPIISNLKPHISNWKDVEKYIDKAGHKTELMRQEDVREKTGVPLIGVEAVNPATKEKITVWIADYVLMSYGTGAIMAVPAHDERDFEFAKKFGLPIKKVIAPYLIDSHDPPISGKKTVHKRMVHAVIMNPGGDKILVLKWKKLPWVSFVSGGVDEGEDSQSAILREIKEETGYVDVKSVEVLGDKFYTTYHAAHKDENREAEVTVFRVALASERKVPVDASETEKFDAMWVSLQEARSLVNQVEAGEIWSMMDGAAFFAGSGNLINSGEFNQLDSEKAKWEIVKFVGGEKKVQYKLRDWSVSRQRYWGVPIPMIYCGKCGITPVAEKDLPVVLPELKDYRPKGVPPLASSEKFMKVKCPKCGGKAQRDPETLDTFVDSSWYYLRYADPKNENSILDKTKTKHWLPVDLYIIGAEHTVLHLLYSRFITKFLHDIGWLGFSEPFSKLRHQGLILGEGGQKMSKSKGNVVNPDDLINEFGADTVRLYEMFMGPFEDGAPWDPKGILGAERFLLRFWKYINSANSSKNEKVVTPIAEKRLIHKTIKKAADDIENFKFNTAISALMILLNKLGEAKENILAKEDLGVIIKLFHPFAPHASQELWELLGHKTILDFEKWPEYDPKLIVDEKFTLVIQVNGRVRDSIEVRADIGEIEAKELALAREKIRPLLGSAKPKKFVYVPKKIINIVV